MERVNQYEFYTLGTQIQPLKEIKGGDKVAQHFGVLLFAHGALKSLVQESAVPLSVCRAAAEKLRREVWSFIPIWEEDKHAEFSAALEKPIEGWQAERLKEYVATFEHVLAAELQTQATYFVSSVGIFSTSELIERAERAFPEAIRSQLPRETVDDWRLAGRCLAFELSTAAGFHMLRATETVIRDYYGVIGKSHAPIKPKSRNWGAYIRALKKCNANTNIIRLLEQIRDLDRNPIMHPEQTLTPDEALTLWGIAIGAIRAMILEMPSAAQSQLALTAAPNALPIAPSPAP